MKRWSSDRWFSFVAIVTSFGTLFTILYQTQLTRKQQYASVLPYLEMWNSSPGREGYNYKYVLINNGIGPAFIRDVKVHYADSTYAIDPANFARLVIKPKDSLSSYFYSNISKGRVVPAGGEIDLVGVKNDTVNAGILRSWFANNDTLQVEIIYESVYGERWSARGVAREPTPID